MSEIPFPYNPKGQKKSDIVRIAHFMNGFLGVEMLYDIPCPDKFLKRKYDDLDEDEQKEWFEYTFAATFRDATFHVVGFLRRELKAVEINLIKRRIMNYFKQSGIEYGN